MNRLLLILLPWLSVIARADFAPVSRWPLGPDACIDSPLRVTFDRPPTVTGEGRIEVLRAADGMVVDAVELGAGESVDRFGVNGGFQLRYDPVWVEGNTAHVRLRTRSLQPGEAYRVRISPGAFRDGGGEVSAGIEDGWTFQTKPAMRRNPDRVIVAADGSGDFCTIQGAVDQIEPHRDRTVVIFVRKGTYRELVRIGRERRHIHLLGEDRKGTVLLYPNNDKRNPGWIQRSVLGVEADDFILENMTVHNTTPYKGSQAEAVCIHGERCVVRKSDILSFQDTLNLNGRVYVVDCYIEGDVDYVWGSGTAYFERCELRTMHDGYLVQARNPASRAGYIFADCRLTAAPEVKRLWLARIETGRFPASHVTFLRCAMGPHIPAEGWLITGPPSDALRFEEFGSTDLDGKQLDTSRRVMPAKTLTAEQAGALSMKNVLRGPEAWDPTNEPLRIVLIGDSTMCEYPVESPRRGWGQFVQAAFAGNVTVFNHAASGRSTKTFIAEGRWKRALQDRPHYVFIQFGHNDSHDPGRPESTDAATNYRDFLRRYIEDARAQNATPVLVTPMVRRIFLDGALDDALLPYAIAMKEVAAEKQVPVIDLHAASMALVGQLGEAGSAVHANEPKDRTHFSEAGAKAMAALVLEALPKSVPALKERLLPRASRHDTTRE